MDHHGIQRLNATHRFADLGEDGGERNHQDEAKADNWPGAIRDHAQKEAFKSKDEVKKRNPKEVEAKIAQLIDKNKEVIWGCQSTVGCKVSKVTWGLRRSFGLCCTKRHDENLEVDRERNNEKGLV
jgi:hypothetical protein